MSRCSIGSITGRLWPLGGDVAFVLGLAERSKRGRG